MPTDSTLLPPWLDRDERKALRRAVQWPAIVRTDAIGEFAGFITDISSSGCRINLMPSASLGRYLLIDIEGVQRIEGWVAWQRENAHGIDFFQPILPNVIVQLTCMLERSNGHSS